MAQLITNLRDFMEIVLNENFSQNGNFVLVIHYMNLYSSFWSLSIGLGVDVRV